MLEIGVMAVLAADESIKARISHNKHGMRIYLGRVPQGVDLKGGAIVVGKTGADHDYGLDGESSDAFTTLQIDCYDYLPQNAESLQDLVTLTISGEAAIGLVARDESSNKDHFIESSEIAGEHSQYQKPIGSTDDWRPRAGRDYRIHHFVRT